MKNQNSKKQSEKQNGKVIQLNLKNKKPSTPKEHSVNRMAKLRDAMFKTINDTATEIQKEGNGEITVNEVIAVTSDMVYNYNIRMLEAQYNEVQPKSKQ